MDIKPLIYLACPYSSGGDQDVTSDLREHRWREVNKAAATLMRQGKKIFSPVSHTHAIAKEGDLPTGWEYWSAFDRAYLEHCHKIIVLQLEGWQNSTGVQAELRIAAEFGLEVEYMDPATHLLSTTSDSF